MLTVTTQQRDLMFATSIRALPNEGCGLLVGSPDGVVSRVVPSANIADSAKIYEIEPRVLLRTFREADDSNEVVLGVFHSHTHSQAYPSPTDVAQAPDPSWHYVLVSLREVPLVLRSYRIVNSVVEEEEVVVAVSPVEDQLFSTLP